MKDLNNVNLIGRLTRDAEVKYTSANTAIVSFGLAVNRSVKKGDRWVDEASFFDVTAFGGTRIVKYLTKGKQIALTGELRQERWQTDGQSRSKVIVIAQDIFLLGSREKQEAFIDDIPF